jgi:hypothetical protein
MHSRLRITQPYAFGAWVLSGSLIPLLSLYGRSLQRWTRQYLEPDTLAWVVGVPACVLVLAAVVWLTRRNGRAALWHALWGIPIFVVLPLTLPIVAERLHFVVFGVFGFLSLRVFGAIVGIGLCLVGSGLDELFQWYLPDRVGDWRDVHANAIASVAGAILAWVGSRR